MMEGGRKATCRQGINDYGEDGEGERVKVRCSCTDTANG